MIEKPEQYYDTRRHQLYYQWRESEHYVHQEPIYDRTRDYIESLKAENAKLRAARDVWAENDAKLRELASGLRQCLKWDGCRGCPMQDDDGWCVRDIRLRELGVEVEE